MYNCFPVHWIQVLHLISLPAGFLESAWMRAICLRVNPNRQKSCLLARKTSRKMTFNSISFLPLNGISSYCILSCFQIDTAGRNVLSYIPGQEIVTFFLACKPYHRNLHLCHFQIRLPKYHLCFNATKKLKLVQNVAA